MYRITDTQCNISSYYTHSVTPITQLLLYYIEEEIRTINRTIMYDTDNNHSDKKSMRMTNKTTATVTARGRSDEGPDSRSPGSR